MKADPSKEAREVYEPPPLKAQPIDAVKSLAPPKFEVITTPPPARERMRAETAPRVMPAPTIIPTHISDIDEEMPTEEISRAQSESVAALLEPEDETDSTKLLVAGGIVGVVLAALVLGFVYSALQEPTAASTTGVPAAAVQSPPEVPSEAVEAPTDVEQSDGPVEGTEGAANPVDATMAAEQPPIEDENAVEEPLVQETTAPASITPPAETDPASKADESVPAIKGKVTPSVKERPKAKVKQKRPRPTSARPPKPPAPKPTPPEPEAEPEETLDSPWGNLD